jgi:hypothetical protein
MRGIARLPRSQSAAAFAIIVFVFLGVWWATSPKADTIRVTYPDEPPLGEDAARWEQVGTRLDEVRVGMARADVEAILGPPEPMNVDAMVKEHTTYHTRYWAILNRPLPFAPDVRGFCEAELTFDASRPGHPLLRITCTPRTPPPSRQTVSMAV